ncbi:MAG: lysine--tRNA ligase [Demequinaceae bacterium]|nr:lysine--tRNA ligase [Demequinaceae bacterium]
MPSTSRSTFTDVPRSAKARGRSAGSLRGVTDELSLPEQMRVRREKRDSILARGGDAYPVGVPKTHEISEVKASYSHLEAGAETEDEVGVAGRVVFIRNTGRLVFATIQDGEGERLQIMVSEDGVGTESLSSFKSDIDLGDHLFSHGRVICSKRGEVSVLAGEWSLAAKALRPLPVLHKDLSEESRVRQRYVDLIARPLARATVRHRSGVVRALRDALHGRGFIEIETPMLQTQPGGATARPFVTHMNAFDLDLYLRIAPELFLKKAVVGGLEKVFEINRNFRNEGADSSHSPEFSMLEVYEAYGDYSTMATLTRDLVQGAAREVFGDTVVELADGTAYDLGGTWTDISLYPALSEALSEEVTPETEIGWLKERCEAAEIPVDPKRESHGVLVEALFEHHIGAHLSAPTFVRDFPVETSPLTRAHRSLPGVVEKWDLYVRGFELATAYSELIDPIIQRERFEEQARLAAQGDDEAMRVDEDFLAAMEFAMPPAGGMGMGIDRLLMALTGLGIRETILFPLVKPTDGP